MNNQSDPFDEIIQASAQRFESSTPAGFYSIHQEPASPAGGLNAARRTTGALRSTGALSPEHQHLLAAEKKLAEIKAQSQAQTEFFYAIAEMNTIGESASLIKRTAHIARQILNASYTMIAIFSQQEWVLRGSGEAPAIFGSLSNGAQFFLDEALKAPYGFRMKDLRLDERAAAIQLDRPDLRSLLVSPIHIEGAPAGLLLAFGKAGDREFSDHDFKLAEMLAKQVGFNLHHCIVSEKLRYHQLLSELISGITEASSLKTAARFIAQTAYKLLQARRCGLVLFKIDGKTSELEVHFPNEEVVFHPIQLITQAMNSRQTIYLSEAEGLTRRVVPIQTPRRCFGALWVDTEDIPSAINRSDDLNVVIKQAAMALERLVLLEELIAQSVEVQIANVELRQANQSLEEAYNNTLKVMMRALDARDSETEEHTQRVTDLSIRLGMAMGLTEEDIRTIERGAILHDIGKIGIRDNVLLKEGPLNDKEWEKMREHPEKGAEIIKEIVFLEKVVPVIKHHQERWDGSGYPGHMKGTEIPLLARIFAVVDVFDALTSKRPYREPMPQEEALKYLEDQAEIHFDPVVVRRFVNMMRASGESDPEPLPSSTESRTESIE